MSLSLLVQLLERAGRLFGLALAPVFLAPEPPVSAHPTIAATLTFVALVLVVVAAQRVRKRIATREADLGAALVVLSILISLVCAVVFQDARAPLGRGVPFVAVPLWFGLATIAWTVVRKRFPDEPLAKARLAAIATLGVGLAQLGASASWLASAEKAWWVTLMREGNSDRALAALSGTNQDAARMRSLVDRCIATNPTHCVCLARRADLQRRSRDLEAALADARSAATKCPSEPSVQVALVTVLVAKGDSKQAEEAARSALQLSDDARLHYALALALEGQGRVQEATDAVRKAIALGAGRDAELLDAALSILSGDLERATMTLNALVAASPNDAEARYNQALIADKKNDYNRAREGYLAALKLDPTLAHARYNLALLTLRRGVVDEARHHARKFAELSPGDPRIAELERRIEAASSGRR
jgi:Flp pilus assembly protein TadD